MNVADFQNLVYSQAATQKRTMPWREDTRAYYVHVSEMMLQQTQVHRVIPKFNDFIARFPNYQVLAASTLQEVLEAWSGLGYNRRARFLHESARQVTALHAGRLPSGSHELQELPGIGINTAAAIRAYAFNEPVVYLETNIRTVYIYHFFPDVENVTDASLLAKVADMLDVENPREWYWALMDYGAYLKKEVGNYSKLSKTYKKQSKFEGSVRQIRGAVMRALIDGSKSEKQLLVLFGENRLSAVLESLENDKLIRLHKGSVSINDVI